MCNCIFVTNKHSKNKDRYLLSGSKEFKIWEGIKKRIRKGYNGLGVSDEWNESFNNFYEDMGPCNGLTIERVDNLKGYCKHNCIWTDKRTQALNRKNLPKKSESKLPVGVNEQTKSNTFYSQISIFGKKKYLGSFKTSEEASLAFFDAYFYYNGKSHKDDKRY